ncbi:helix-turn-helix domain-containing protein [Amycolatopsis pithecellobii]|nr:helix-turn-helix transcriptional regulator [Amycolatopsis pithecellobii]
MTRSTRKVNQIVIFPGLMEGGQEIMSDDARHADDPPPRTRGEKIVWMLARKLRPYEDSAVLQDPKRKRKRKPYRQKDLAAAIGVSAVYINTIIKNPDRRVSFDVMSDISAWLGVTSDVFSDRYVWDEAEVLCQLNGTGPAKAESTAVALSLRELGEDTPHAGEEDFQIRAARAIREMDPATLEKLRPIVASLIELCDRPDLLAQFGEVTVFTVNRGSHSAEENSGNASAESKPSPSEFSKARPEEDR